MDVVDRGTRGKREKGQPWWMASCCRNKLPAEQSASTRTAPAHPHVNKDKRLEQTRRQDQTQCIKCNAHDVHDGAPAAEGVAVHRGEEGLGEHLEELVGLLCGLVGLFCVVVVR